MGLGCDGAGGEGPACSGLLSSGFLLAEPNPVGEEVSLMQSIDASLWGALSKVEGVESASGKKNSSQAYLLFPTGLLECKKQVHSWSPPGEKHVMGWNLKGRNAGGCGVLKKIS